MIIALLSGMRDSEVKHLRRGCLGVSPTQTDTCRWMISSLRSKASGIRPGANATWVVGNPVAQAIEVLENLQPPGTDLLFTQLPYGPGTAPPGSRSRSKRHQAQRSPASRAKLTSQNSPSAPAGDSASPKPPGLPVTSLPG